MQDGTYVECAGMIEDPDYTIKIGQKRELARVLGIPLIIVGPTDLARLPQIFVSHIQRPRIRALRQETRN